jgi:hypothetical protein
VLDLNIPAERAEAFARLRPGGKLGEAAGCAGAPRAAALPAHAGRCLNRPGRTYA